MEGKKKQKKKVNIMMTTDTPQYFQTGDYPRCHQSLNPSTDGNRRRDP